MVQICVSLPAEGTEKRIFSNLYSDNLGPHSSSNHWSFLECDNYIVDPVDEGVDAAVAHGQDVAPHPHVVDASEAATFDFISVVLQRL